MAITRLIISQTDEAYDVILEIEYDNVHVTRSVLYQAVTEEEAYRISQAVQDHLSVIWHE